MTVTPKKHLGQHFLTDKNIAQKIVGLLSADAAQTVVEIGPGRGVLTQYLLARYPSLRIIEIDDEAVQYIRSEFAAFQPQVIHTDFLQWKPANDIGPNASFIGNLPYNISSPIFFSFLDNRAFVQEAVCMIQKEVAERIAAPPGSKTYGILSVLLGYYFDIKYEFSVPPSVFAPPPKVMSAVITLRRKDVPAGEVRYERLKHIVKAAFNQRRKTLRNALKGIELPDFPEKEHLLTLRAEQLSVADFVKLAQ